MKPLSLLRSSRLSELFKDSIAYGYRLSISIIALLCTVNFAFAGEIWVSVTGNDKHAGTREMPLRK